MLKVPVCFFVTHGVVPYPTFTTTSPCISYGMLEFCIQLMELHDIGKLGFLWVALYVHVVVHCAFIKFLFNGELFGVRMLNNSNLGSICLC